jgi:hypothetical protein
MVFTLTLTMRFRRSRMAEADDYLKASAAERLLDALPPTNSAF